MRYRPLRRSDAATCREATRLLQTYLDGEVEQASADRIRRHLQACRRCGLEAGIYTEIKDTLAHRERTVDEDALARLHAFARHLTASDGHGGAEGL